MAKVGNAVEIALFEEVAAKVQLLSLATIIKLYNCMHFRGMERESEIVTCPHFSIESES